MENQDNSNNFKIGDDILNAAKEAYSSLFPYKSKERYNKYYNQFCEWRTNKNVTEANENIGKYLSCKINNPVFCNSKNCYSKLYEPEYLESMKSSIPLYNVLNIQFKGYDYPVLENYQKFVHKLLKSVDISVEECWATPHQYTQVIKYKPKSSVIDSEYKLKQYERNIQVTELNSLQYPVLLRILEASLPEGVTLNVHEHDDYYDEQRYVPDKELLQLKTQLDDIASSKKK